MLSISLLHPEEAFMSNSKQLGKKDFSMEQLPVASDPVRRFPTLVWQSASVNT